MFNIGMFMGIVNVFLSFFKYLFFIAQYTYVQQNVTIFKTKLLITI